MIMNNHNETIKLQKWIINKIEELNIDTRHRQLELFSQMCSHVFHSCTELKTISWTQYTPNFIDGLISGFDIQSEISFSSEEPENITLDQHITNNLPTQVEKNEVICFFEVFMRCNPKLLKNMYNDDDEDEEGYFIRIHRNGELLVKFEHE